MKDVSIFPSKFNTYSQPISLKMFSERIDKNGWSIFRDKVPNQVTILYNIILSICTDI